MASKFIYTITLNNFIAEYIEAVKQGYYYDMQYSGLTTAMQYGVNLFTEPNNPVPPAPKGIVYKKIDKKELIDFLMMLESAIKAGFEPKLKSFKQDKFYHIKFKANDTVDEKEEAEE